ncbi:MAG TPA: DUF3592 domain-containing protein [Candidatus Angelobacter sp.]
MPYDFLARLAVKAFGTLVFPVINTWRERRRRFRSGSWVMIYGQIRNARAIPQWVVYTVSVNYTYSVNGQNYPGSLELRFAWKNSADALVATFSPGMAVSVRYNPAQPQESVLLMDEQPMLAHHF